MPVLLLCQLWHRTVLWIWNCFVVRSLHHVRSNTALRFAVHRHHSDAIAVDPLGCLVAEASSWWQTSALIDCHSCIRVHLGPPVRCLSPILWPLLAWIPSSTLWSAVVLYCCHWQRRETESLSCPRNQYNQTPDLDVGQTEPAIDDHFWPAQCDTRSLGSG